MSDRHGPADSAAHTARGGSVRPLPRPARLRRSPLAFRIGMTLIAIGGLALAVIVTLYASGRHSIPWWLWAITALMLAGFTIAGLRISRAGRSVG